MEKLRILVISNMYPSKSSATFGIFVKNQVDMLVKCGHKVEVLAITNPNSSKLNVITKYFLWLFKGFVLLIRGYQFDIIHVHYVFPSGGIGLLFKWIWKRKLIVTSHGGDIDKMAKKSHFIHKWTYNILNKADHVIAVGQGLYHEINTEYAVKKNRLTLLSMGVNMEVFNQQKNQGVLRTESLLDKHAKVILFVGNIVPDKGVKELIKAYSLIKRQYSNTVLRIIGTVKNKLYFDELNSIIDEENLSDIKFEGPLPPNKVAEWMNTADVLVLPSYKEGFGLVALEAMACGVPVVGSDIGGLSTLLAGDCGILFPPGDVIQLSNGIIKVLIDEKSRKSIIANGVARAKEHDQDKITKKLLAIYQNTLKKKATQKNK